MRPEVFVLVPLPEIAVLLPEFEVEVVLVGRVVFVTPFDAVSDVRVPLELIMVPLFLSVALPVFSFVLL